MKAFTLEELSNIIESVEDFDVPNDNALPDRENGMTEELREALEKPESYKDYRSKSFAIDEI